MSAFCECSVEIVKLKADLCGEERKLKNNSQSETKS